MSVHIDLSIIIVNWNTCDYLRRCLFSIREFSPTCVYEVVVVDNASIDGSADMVRQEFNDTILISNTDNLCYAEGNNQGISASKGKFVLLLNPDTEVTPNSIDALVSFGRSHANSAAVGCRLIGPDGAVQSSCRSFPDPLGVLFEFTRLSRLFPSNRRIGSYRMTWFDYQHESEVDQPMGSCLLLPRKAILDVGLFDQEFPIFFNEVDWCYRAKEKGWKIYFTPTAEVKHYGGAGTRQVKSKMILESHRSLIKFYEKHYKKKMSPVLYRIIIKTITISAFISSRLKSVG